MKFWFPALCLLALFALAALWQTRWRSELRREHERAWSLEGAAPASEGPPGLAAPLAEEPAPALPAAEPRAVEDGWSHVVVGRPSGVEPLLPIEAPPAPRAAALAGTEGPGGTVRHRVEPGESLSVICQRHYGSARASLVDALARHNGLTDPDDLRAGRVLELPPLEALHER